VLDAVGRSRQCFSQIEQLLDLAKCGTLRSGDTIYLDDFWTPGLEALPYLFQQIGIEVNIFGFLYAQSVDEYDFTHSMRDWMSPMEQGYAKLMAGIFVAHPLLKDLIVEGGIAMPDKVFVTGHAFCSEEVEERMPYDTGPWDFQREDKVVYSSRWDWEKDPTFFLNVARLVKAEMPHVKFVVCSGFEQIKSNRPELLVALHDAVKEGVVEVKANLEKHEYYRELCTAKVQFNCAFQDFEPFTLLEASVAGCWPVYPRFRSFPWTFRSHPEHLYDWTNINNAAGLVAWAVAQDGLWNEESIRKRSWIHERHDDSWRRQALIMGLIPGEYDGNECW